MKRILFALLLGLCAVQSVHAVTFTSVQHGYVDVPDTTTPYTTFDSATITGVVVGHWTAVVFFGCPAFACAAGQTQTPATVTGTLGNTYFRCGVYAGASELRQIGIWWAYVATGGSETVTLSNYGGSGANLYNVAADLIEVTGIDPAATCNAEGGSWQAATTAPSVTTTSSVPSGYVVMAYCYAGATTWDAPATDIGASNHQYPAAYKITAGAGAVTISGTESVNIALCASGALLGYTASSLPTGSLMMMGVGK